MYARVATFEGSDPGRARQGVEEIKRRAAGRPPEGVPAVGFLLLHKTEDAKVLSITLFETEEELRQGDEALNAMDPPVSADPDRRRSVEVYDVAVKIDR
jgi:hypothetical protein